MRLCFDATRFGSGLDGAIELASQKGLSAVEYTFAPFVTGKAPKKLDAKEKKSLAQVAKLGKDKEVSFACLNLDYSVDAEDQKSVKQFIAMLAKLRKWPRFLRARPLLFGDGRHKRRMETTIRGGIPLHQ